MWLLLALQALLVASDHAANDTCGFSLAFNADAGECLHPYDYCGVFGTPHIHAAWNASAATNPHNASFSCGCTHAYGGPACNTCNATAFCASPDATCADDPHATHWCVCGDTPGVRNWRPWWRATDPQSPCNACPQGDVPGPGDACVDLATVCGGAGVDSVLSQFLGVCTCARGWRRSVEGVDVCDVCVDGFSLHGGECLDCTDMCGGSAYATCVAPPGDCVCNPGVAGPPCVAGECLPGHVWDAEANACVECPTGCGDAGDGTCVLTATGGAKCVCGAGWAGANCTACADNTVLVNGTTCTVCPPCAGGTCADVGGAATCVCPPLWAGDAECTTCTPGIAVPSTDFKDCVGCDPTCADPAVCTLVGTDAAECLCPEHYVTNGAGGCASCSADDTTGPVQGCVACPDCTNGRACVGVLDGGEWGAACACDGDHTWWGDAQCVAPVSWPAAQSLATSDPVYGGATPAIHGYTPATTQRVDLFIADLYMASGVLCLLVTFVVLATWLT